MCTLSVIVPIYNAESYLVACLESLIRQTLHNIEIILINDGSTDHSEEIATTYCQKNSRVKLICQKNQGISEARNTGLKQAKGKYVAFVDSDDWVIYGAYERLIAVAEQYQVEMVMGNLLYCCENGTRKDPFKRNNKAVFETPLSGRDCFIRLNEQKAFNTMVVAYLYRRDFIENNQLRFVPSIFEDTLWTPVAMCLATKITVIDFNFYAYRQHPDSITHSNNPTHYQALIFMTDKLFDFTIQHCLDKNDPELKCWLFSRIIWLYREANNRRRNIESYYIGL